MKIIKKAQAGTMESGDVYVTVEPMPGGEPEIELESLVMAQYGRQILTTIKDTLEAHGLKGIKISVKDRGALEYALRSRIETAIFRASEEGDQ